MVGIWLKPRAGGHANSLKRMGRQAGRGWLWSCLAGAAPAGPHRSAAPQPRPDIAWPQPASCGYLGLFHQHLGVAHRPGGGTNGRCCLVCELAGGGELATAGSILTRQVRVPHRRAVAVTAGAGSGGVAAVGAEYVLDALRIGGSDALVDR